MSPGFEECLFEGETGIKLVSGDAEATFLPRVGMTGVSLRHRGNEYLEIPGGVAGLRKRSTAGLPLLAPWANRLSTWEYTVGDTHVDLTGSSLPTRDSNDLPIHGLLLGSVDWQIDDQKTGSGRARLEASIDVDMPEFPFRHRLSLTVSLGGDHLEVTTTLMPTGPESVPVSFGWHPYLRLAESPRSHWVLRLPDRDHIALDQFGIPTGDSTYEEAENAPVSNRTFDDLYKIRQGRRLSVETGELGLEMHCGSGYEYFQVWVPPGREFLALEPMVAPTNALIDGTAPLVGQGDAYSAQFRVGLGNLSSAS